jgi:hypothetical protein
MEPRPKFHEVPRYGLENQVRDMIKLQTILQEIRSNNGDAENVRRRAGVCLGICARILGLPRRVPMEAAPEPVVKKRATKK